MGSFQEVKYGRFSSMVFHISGQHMYTSLRGGCATISVNLGESTIERNLV